MSNFWTFKEVSYSVYLDCWRDNTDEGKNFYERELQAKSALAAVCKRQKALEQKLKEKQISDDNAEYKKNQEEIAKLNDNLKKVFEEQSLAFNAYVNKQYRDIKHKDLKQFSKEMKEISGYNKSGFDFQVKFSSEEEAKRRDLRLRLTSKMMEAVAKERLFHTMCLAYGSNGNIKVKSPEFNLFYVYDNKGLNYDTVKEAAADRFILNDHTLTDQEHMDKVYSVFHKAIKTVDQASLDFLANKREWTDEDIVNNFEIIDKVSRLTSLREDFDSQTQRNNDEQIPDPNDPSKKIKRPRRSQSKTDPELNQFFVLNEKALTKALELSQRAGFIQSMYYEKTEVNRPEINQFIKADLQLDDDSEGITEFAFSLNFESHDAEREKVISKTADYKNGFEQVKADYISQSAEEKMNMFIRKTGINDIYDTSFFSATNSLSENLMLIKNVFRASGADTAAVRIVYDDDNGEQTLKDGTFNASTQIHQDEILSMYERVVNLDTSFKFTDLDHPENSIAVPRDMLLDPTFAEKLRSEIAPGNLYNKIPEPVKPAKASQQAQYEKDLAFSKLANSYKESMQKMYIADIQRRQAPNERKGEEAEKSFEQISKNAQEANANTEKLAILNDTTTVYNSFIKGKKNLSQFDKAKYERAAELITDLAQFAKSDAIDAQMKKQLDLAANTALMLSKSKQGGLSKSELQQITKCIKSLDAYEKVLSEQAMDIMDEKSEYQVAKRQDMVSILKDQFVDQINEHKDLQAGKSKGKEPVVNKSANQRANQVKGQAKGV